MGFCELWLSILSSRCTQEIFCSDRPHRAVWLAVHEGGVSLLNSSTMGTISSYSYGEISTFGGSRDNDFIMVVSPQPKEEEEGQPHRRGTMSRNNSSGGVVHTEKLVLTMPKLQVLRQLHVEPDMWNLMVLHVLSQKASYYIITTSNNVPQFFHTLQRPCSSCGEREGERGGERGRDGR